MSYTPQKFVSKEEALSLPIVGFWELYRAIDFAYGAALFNRDEVIASRGLYNKGYTLCWEKANRLLQIYLFQLVYGNAKIRAKDQQMLIRWCSNSRHGLQKSYFETVGPQLYVYLNKLK